MNKELKYKIKPKFYDEIKEYSEKMGGTFNQLVNNLKVVIRYMPSYKPRISTNYTYKFIVDLFNKYNRIDDVNVSTIELISYDNIKYKYMDLENIIINTLSVIFDKDYNPYDIYCPTLHSAECQIDKDCVRWRDIGVVPANSEDKDKWDFIEINEPVVFTKTESNTDKLDVDETIKSIKRNNNIDKIYDYNSDAMNYYCSGYIDIGSYCVKCYNII